jgi:hypothetical protein
MSLRLDNPPHASEILLLRRCYAFINDDWQHARREPLPDQGFEEQFRENCILSLNGWTVSQPREMRLGCGLDTASGVLHEVDLVAQLDDLVGILELKNRPTPSPDKNDVIVFFAKLLDYFTLNPALLQRRIAPAFMSCFPFEASGIAACLGLGIHPIAPRLRPLPLLYDNARRMTLELNSGLRVGSSDRDAFDDLCANLNRMELTVEQFAINQRFDYFSDRCLMVHSIAAAAMAGVVDDLRSLNGECTRLIPVFQSAKAARDAS